jgi:hypothetical protein
LAFYFPFGAHNPVAIDHFLAFCFPFGAHHLSFGSHNPVAIDHWLSVSLRAWLASLTLLWHASFFVSFADGRSPHFYSFLGVNASLPHDFFFGPRPFGGCR